MAAKRIAKDDRTESEVKFSLGIIGLGQVGKTIASRAIEELEGLEKLVLYNRPDEQGKNTKAEAVKIDLLNGLHPYFKQRIDLVVAASSIDETLDTDFLAIAVKERYNPLELPRRNRRHLMLDKDRGIFEQVAESTRGYKGVYLVLSNPISALLAMLDSPPEKKIGLSPDSIRFGDTLRDYYAHVLGMKKKHNGKKLPPLEKLSVENAIVIGDHAETLVPLYSQAVFIAEGIGGGKPRMLRFEEILPLPKRDTPWRRFRLNEIKAGLTKQVLLMGELAYTQSSSPTLGTARAFISTMEAILHDGITYGAVAYEFEGHTIYVQLPASWVRNSKGFKVFKVYSPTEIPSLHPSTHTPPLLSSELEAFRKSCYSILGLYKRHRIISDTRVKISPS